MNRRQLILEHLPLVHQIAHQTAARLPNHVHVDILVSAGMEALVRTAGEYNPDRGVPFKRYAQPRIKGAMLDELRATDTRTGPRARKGSAVLTLDMAGVADMPADADRQVHRLDPADITTRADTNRRLRAAVTALPDLPRRAVIAAFLTNTPHRTWFGLIGATEGDFYAHRREGLTLLRATPGMSELSFLSG